MSTVAEPSSARIRATCECGRRLKVAARHAGRRVRCPACRAPVVVEPLLDLAEIESPPRDLPREADVRALAVWHLLASLGSLLTAVFIAATLVAARASYDPRALPVRVPGSLPGWALLSTALAVAFFVAALGLWSRRMWAPRLVLGLGLAVTLIEVASWVADAVHPANVLVKAAWLALGAVSLSRARHVFGDAYASDETSPRWWTSSVAYAPLLLTALTGLILAASS